MKTLIFHFTENNKDVASFIKKNKIKNGKTVLVQMFSGIVDENLLKNLTREIIDYLPHAQIIGATTSGEIVEGSTYEETIAISFTIFEKTQCKSLLLPHNGDSFQAGADLAKYLVGKDTKALIVFGDGLTGNGEFILRGIQSVAPKVLVAGGMAGDNIQFQKTIVFNEKDITCHGVVGVALNNPNLVVQNTYNFNWKKIGRPMMVTKAKDNRIYTINDIPVLDIYTKYLGKGIADLMPSVEFPLMVERNGMKIARDVIFKHDDGSFSVAGNIHEGEKVQFAYGDIDMILDSSKKLIKDIQEKPIDAIFVYSCTARKIFMEKSIEKEIASLAKIAPVTGFFTYGEFFHGKSSNEVFNETMTLLTLSEKDVTDIPKKKVAFSRVSHGNERRFVTLKGLTHLTQVVTGELTDLTNNLEEKVKEQTNELRENFEKLKEIDRLKTEFISIASHELRTPMTVIKTYTSLLLDKSFAKGLSDQQVEFLEKIFKNTSQLIGLVNDMLDITKLESGRMDFDMKNINLCDFIPSVLSEFTYLYEEKNISLICEAPNDNKSLEIHADEEKLRRVFMNLLSNALKFTPKDGKVSISCKISKEYVNIDISDTGIGIPSDKLEQIFERFSQVDNPMQRDYEGTGLGLSIVKTMLEKMDASISVKSKVNKGSIFTMSFKKNIK